jgi:hypothetical protein
LTKKLEIFNAKAEFFAKMRWSAGFWEIKLTKNG